MERLTLTDKQDSNGLWLKSYTVGGQNYKTRSGRLWNNLEVRTSGRHKDKCYNNAVNGFKDFQEFAEWCQSQPAYLALDLDGKFWQLDKDILGDGELYSPETCCFIPGKLNSLLIEQESEAGLMPGVSLNLDNSDKFVARGRLLSGKKKHIGVYNTEQEAHEAYINFKREVVSAALQQMALPVKAVEALKVSWNI